ncbi:hypothetical protein PSN13_06517 [Micromonospora saelicesensis]|uniref:Uncharacterized protein n=1 Tax=Micromonospora saelicesensis TaxID=285676 RepID=A0A328NBT8_9ACTN|nr:hypothetical protein [Micromonospora saelicesensis]RAO26489.1 hypothetical protein PSN13_06517 [Micromonospora saelicesensis]
MTILCVAAHCGIPHHHTDDCPDPETCHGCLPRLAADGLRLCEVDTRRLAEDALAAARLHDDLALRLMPGGRGGEKVATSSSGAPTVDGEVVEARSAIRATLVSLCRLIADERGHQLPQDATEALGGYVAHHARWLAAHAAADEHARDLRDIASDPRTRRLAYPAGTDRLYIGDCPLIVRDLDGAESVCGTRVYQYGERQLIGCDGCGTDETVEWWQREIVGDASATVDAYAGAADLALRFHRPVDPALIRKWASLEARKAERNEAYVPRVNRCGKDGKQRTLYDLKELREYAERVWAPVAA